MFIHDQAIPYLYALYSITSGRVSPTAAVQQQRNDALCVLLRGPHGLLRAEEYLQEGKQLGDVMLGGHGVNDAIKAVRNGLHGCHITLSTSPAE